MKQESILYLDKVACIARANMAYHQQKPQDQRDLDEAGIALLMSSFLEMYDHWQNAETGREEPPKRVYIAASSCVELRKQLELEPRHSWTDEEEGLFQMMTAYMFLFKHMYVPQN